MKGLFVIALVLYVGAIYVSASCDPLLVDLDDSDTGNETDSYEQAMVDDDDSDAEAEMLLHHDNINYSTLPLADEDGWEVWKDVYEHRGVVGDDDGEFFEDDDRDEGSDISDEYSENESFQAFILSLVSKMNLDYREMALFGGALGVILLIFGCNLGHISLD